MLELVVRLVFSLAVVVGLLLLLARFGAKRFNSGTDAPIKVLHRQSLSRNGSVALISVGGRVLVLGTTDQQVSLLTELDPDEIDITEPTSIFRPRSSEPTTLEQAERPGRPPARPVEHARPSPGRHQRLDPLAADVAPGLRRGHQASVMTHLQRLGFLLLVVIGLSIVPLALTSVLGESASAAPAGVSSVSSPAVGTASLAVAAASPQGPKGPNGPKNDTSVRIDLDGLTDKPSTSVTVIVAMTLLSLLPALLLTCTSFTKILVVLGLTRNALGLQQIPNNQVLAGLALFLSLFIMGPVLSQMNDIGLQPYLDGDKSTTQAYNDGIEPLREFMLDQSGDDELMLLTNVAGRDLPDDRSEVGMSTLVPAFVLSELKQAFIIGFIIFIPFLVIDIVVSGALMALGMMMMPPVMVSLPFKLLLFVLVDGWALVIKSLVTSYG